MTIDSKTMTAKPSLFYRIVAFISALALLLTMLPDSVFNALADTGDGEFNISLSWNNYTPIPDPGVEGSEADASVYIYDSDRSENRVIRLKISYSNKKVSHAYAPGTLNITVNGIKGAVRTGTSYIPAEGAVAADPELSTTKSRDWSYSYSSATDTFTFTNNNEIGDKSTFEGSFEIMWTLPSRDTKHGYAQDFQAELTADGNSVLSNTVSYKQYREKDTYDIGGSGTNEVTSADTPVYLPTSGEDGYTWVKYQITAQDTYLARDVEGSERFDLYFPEDVLVYGGGLVKDESKTKIGEDGKTYVCYSVEKDVTATKSGIYLDNIMVAYPLSEYPVDTPEDDKTKLTVYAELWGKYYEENYTQAPWEERLAACEIHRDLDEYDYEDIPGPVYDVTKDSYGVHSAYIDQQQNTPHGAVNSVHLTNGEGTYYSNLRIELNYNRQWAKSYDLEFYDDLMDITYGEGLYRSLDDSKENYEYNFTAVTIPANTGILDKSGDAMETGKDIDIYVRHAGADYDDYELYRSVKLTSTQQRINISYKDVVGVKVVYNKIDKTINTNTTMARVDYVFHISDDEIKNVLTDGGSLVNNMFFLLYGYDEEDNRVWWNPFTREQYISDMTEDEYTRDRERYGDMIDKFKNGYVSYNGEDPDVYNGLDREKYTLPIIEIPNEFKVSNTKIVLDNDDGSTFDFTGSTRANFTLDDSSDVTEFSLYTIIPEGLRLDELRNNPELLLEVLDITSSDGLSSAFLTSHLKITIIDDPEQYNGRQYISFDFDFSDSPIHSDWIQVSGIPMYVNKRDLAYGAGQYTLTTGMLVHQDGKWYSNSTDNNMMDGGIWSNLDRDDDTEEPASFDSNTVTYNYSQATQVALTKFVKTTLTNGPVNPDPTDPIDEIPMTYMGGDYWYILKAEVGAGAAVNQIIFADVIESVRDNDSEWQGIFAGIDYSEVLNAIGDDAWQYEDEIEIYYSTVEETFTQDANEKNIINLETLQGGNWTKVKPADEDIRSVAVYFGENIAAPPETVMNLIIKMTAPDDTAYIGKIAKNSSNIGYVKQNDMTKEFDEPEYLPSNVVPVRYTAPGMIVLNKKDAEDGSALVGATFYLYKKGENGGTDIQIKNENADEGTDPYLFTVKENGRLIITGLEYGSYYFVEQSAPKGYDSENGWMVDMDGNTLGEIELSEDALSAAIDFLNARKDGSFTVRKISDRYSGTVLSGAKFHLYTSDGTILTDDSGEPLVYVSGNDGTFTVDGLEWGDYYLQEFESPTGYELSETKIAFTIGADGDAGRELGVDGVTDVKNEQIPAAVLLTKYELNPLKYDQYEQFDQLSPGEYMDDSDVNGTTVAGAVYNLYIYYNGDTSDRKLIATRTTNKDGVIRIDNLAFGTYYFEEIQAANGYQVSVNKVFFELTPDYTNDEPREIITADPRSLGNVSLMKKDDAGMPVKGAKFVLLDDKGNEVKLTKDTSRDGSYYIYDPDNGNITEMETTDEGFFRIDGLPWGDYSLKETEAPRGYELDPDSPYTFTVDNVHITVEQIKSTDPRKKGIVEITKVSEKDNDLILEGAVFNLYKNDGTQISVEKVIDAENGDYYKVVSDGDNFDIVNETGVIRIIDIDWGSYYLLETKAPSGYGIYDKKIRFSVNYLTGGVVQAITVEDPAKECEFIVTKKIENDDIVFAHGNPTFIFEVTRIDDGDPDDVGHTYRKSITFSHGDLTLDSDTSSLLVKFKVPAGTYKITEISVNRYELDGIALLNGDAKNVTIDDDSVTVILTGDEEEEDEFEFEFTNKKTDQEGTSHTVIRPNILARERKLTAIIANYTGPDILTEETIDTSKLEVWAVYDDGTQELLKYAGDPHTDEDKCYTMDPAVFDGDMNGDYTVTVIYEENGIERTDTFDIEVRLTSNFAWEFVEQYTEPKYDEYGNEYWGEVYITAYTGTASSIHFPAYVLGRMIIPTQTTSTGYIAELFTPYADQTEGINGKLFKVVQVGSNVNGAAGRVALRVGVITITELTFEEGIEIIGQHAFNSNMYRLDSDLIIPDSMREICENSFFNVYSGSGSTHSIIFGEDSNLERIGKNAFYNCSRLANTDLILPSKLRVIEAQAFYTTGLNGDLTIPNIQMIGYRAFGNSDGLNGTLTVAGGSYDDAVLCNGSFGGNSTPFTEVIIGEGVVSIGLDAFGSIVSLTKVTFPDSLLEISVNVGDPTITPDYSTNGAFQGCTHLAALELPKNLQIIGDGAFANCNSTGYCFTEVEIPASVQKIGRGAFYLDRIEKLTLPATITSPDGLEISVEAAGKTAARTNYGSFESCTLLTEIVLSDGSNEPGEIVFPDGVTVIGDRAFYLCSKLAGKLIIPDSVTLIGQYAFSGCAALTALTLGTNTKATQLEKIDKYAFNNCSKIAGDLVVPDSVETIESNAFAQDTSLETITIGNSVTLIGDSAFNYCTAATSLTFAKGGDADTLKIDRNAFNACSALTGDLELPDRTNSIGNSAFYNAYKNFPAKVGNLILNSGLVTIEGAAFRYTQFNGGLTIPASLETVGDSAFQGCSDLTSLTFETGGAALVIGNNAFADCTKIGFATGGDLTIPANVNIAEIKNAAFTNCSFSGSLTIEDRDPALTLTGAPFYQANSNNAGFTGDLYVGTGVNITGTAFSGNNFAGSLTLHIGNADDGATVNSNLSSGWFGSTTAIKNFSKDLTVGGKIETIGDQTFNGAGFSGTLTLGENVKIIGANALSSNKFAGELIIPDGVTTIGGYAFDGSGFTGDLTIPDSVQILGVAPFRNCTFNGDLYIGSGLNPDASDGTYTMGYYFFRNCTFNNVTILSGDGASGTQIGGNVLFGGTYNGKLTVGGNIVTIAGSAFSNDGDRHTDFTDVEIQDSVKAIGNNAFQNCNTIAELAIGNSVETIGNSAFDGCSALTGDLIIPNSVVSIGSNAFLNCSSLTKLTIGNSVQTIGDSAFNGCTSLSGDLTIPDSVTSIGGYAFRNTNFVGKLVMSQNIKSIGNYAFWLGDYADLTGIVIFPDDVTLNSGVLWGVKVDVYYPDGANDPSNNGANIKYKYSDYTDLKSKLNENGVPQSEWPDWLKNA